MTAKTMKKTLTLLSVLFLTVPAFRTILDLYYFNMSPGESLSEESLG